MSRSIWLLPACLILTAHLGAARGEQAAVAAAVPQAATECSVKPKAFNPTAGGKVAFKFKLTGVPAAKVWLVDPIGRVVGSAGAVGPGDSGFFTAEWDGRGSDGQVLPNDAYCYLPAPADYSPPPEGLPQLAQAAGERLECKDITYDAQTGEIRYLLPQAGRTRLRAGVKDGPVVRTMLDWAPQPAGRHAVVWDGKDSRGTEWARAAALVHIWAFSLPQDCVIIHGGAAPAYPVHEKYFQTPAAPKPDLHATHARQGCHEPRFSVSFPDVSAGSNAPITPKNGRLAARVLLDPRDHKALVENLFEIVFYIDGVFFFEDSNASDPFGCTLDLTRVSKGQHVLSVQVMDFEDHAASRSFRIACQEPGR